MPDESLRVSTSAKYGAMIGNPVCAVTLNGVNVLCGRVNVTLPLLFTYSELNVLPKKFSPKPSSTRFVEPSSFRKRAG